MISYHFRYSKHLNVAVGKGLASMRRRKTLHKPQTHFTEGVTCKYVNKVTALKAIYEIQVAGINDSFGVKMRTSEKNTHVPIIFSACMPAWIVLTKTKPEKNGQWGDGRVKPGP